MKFRVNTSTREVPAAAGSQIYVYYAGTTVLHPALFDGSGNTLANPYSHPGGMVTFQLPAPAKVQIGVKPAGAASPVVSPIIPNLERQLTYTFQKSGGAASQWVVS